MIVQIKVGNSIAKSSEEEANLVIKYFGALGDFERKIEAITATIKAVSEMNEYFEQLILRIEVKKEKNEGSMLDNKERLSLLTVLDEAKNLSRSLRKLISPFSRFHDDIKEHLGTMHSNLGDLLQMEINSAIIVLNTTNRLIEKGADLAFE